PHVVGAAPAILGQALLANGSAREAASIKGIDPSLEPSVTDIVGAMKSGSIAALAPKASDDTIPGILLGKDLATKLGVGVGDSILLTTAEGILTPNGRLPYPRRLRLAGIFSLGLYELDTSSAYVTLDAAKRLFAKDQVDLIQLRVDDIYRAPAIA